MKIIPAIDIIDGKCVRLSQGDYSRMIVYKEDPLEAAKEFEDFGIEHIHLVDLDGAKASEIKNLKVLERIAGNTKLKIDFGGGVKMQSDVENILNAGAHWVTIGSLAVKNPGLLKNWITEFGNDSFMLGADVRNTILQLKGWTESSTKNVFEFIDEYTSLGVKNIFCTDIECDGMLKGPSLNLYKEILGKNKNVNLIASGGVGSIEDLKQLKEVGCHGAIVGKAIYEGKIKLEELKNI